MDIAKIFTHPSGKQIVVLRGESEICEPRIEFLVEPDDLGVCRIAYTYPDTDEGHATRDRVFDERVDADFAIRQADRIIDGARFYDDSKRSQTITIDDSPNVKIETLE